MLLTFFLVLIGWIVFRAESIGEAWGYLQNMISITLFSKPDAPGVTSFSIAICLMLVVEWLQRKKPHAFDLSHVNSKVLRYAFYFVVVFMTFALSGHTENFIYFQF